ncbi:Mrp/NBP35 family ATP-binding protein [candidate division WOR-3 bacterium]|nr:Mrp/NBP35 family ATP-binding protein [candidate division WOR-3 bacterium]
MNEKSNEDIKVAETLSKIKNRLLVFSGKGGVGKSTVAANLGVALSERQLKVGLLDVDIHGPNLAKMLGVENERLVSAGENSILPVAVTKHLSVVSMAFLLQDKNTPVIWRGPMKMKVIQQFLGDVVWGNLDWLVIDSPPGTGDEPLSVAQLIPATGAIIVTTPQEVSLLDSRKAVNFARKLNLKIYGVIENMSGLICPHCGKVINLFKEGGGEKIARELGVTFLGKIPLDPKIVESGDSGKPFFTYDQESQASKAFGLIVDKILNTNSKQ